VNDYRVMFTADANRPLGPDAGGRLAKALAGMPGAEGVESAERDGTEGRVTATFWIKVRLGMADAARDGSRLAKEALKAAGMGDAQLIELSVSLGETPAPRRK
jgi:hypothetical protein